MGTATQYLSGLVTELRIKYPDDSIWEGITDLKVTPVWYHNIIDRVEKDVKKRCADNGVPVSKKVLGVGRELLKRTVDYKMSLGTAEGCRDIFTMVRLFLYHGRGKELTYSTYDDIRVDEDQEEMKSDWTRIKNFNVSETAVVPDANPNRLAIRLFHYVRYLSCSGWWGPWCYDSFWGSKLHRA